MIKRQRLILEALKTIFCGYLPPNMLYSYVLPKKKKIKYKKKDKTVVKVKVSKKNV